MDRSMNSPDRAFETLLGKMSNKVMSLERRIRWPGATMFTEELETVTFTGNGNWHQLCSLPLEAGRWMVYASAVLDPSGLTEIQVSDGVSLPSGTSSPYISSLSIISPLLLLRPASAILEGRAPSGSVICSQSFIIAVPT